MCRVYIVKCINLEGQVTEKLYFKPLLHVQNSLHFLFHFIWGSFLELKYQMAALAKVFLSVSGVFKFGC
jgi:hypothetical protein